MYYLLRRKITLLFTFLLTASALFAQRQLNQEGHDDKPYHFGIALGYNQSHFSFNHHPRFLEYDSIMSIESINNPGLNMAILANLRLNDHFDVRAHPFDLTFSEKAFQYTQNYEPDTMVTKKIQSITLAFPVNIAFTSDRIGNLKVYTFLGGRYDYDMASNAKATMAGDLVKLKRSNISAELGLGFHIYFPYFVLSPEIKLSNGLVNLHSRDTDLKYSNVIDRIYSRMITFSLTVE